MNELIQLDERGQFTFYKSFFEAAKRIKSKTARCDFYDAICEYALNGIEPDLDKLSDAAAVGFIGAKPNLDASRRKAENGKQGGKKVKKTESKPEANGKQTASEKENEKEKENEIENECYFGGAPKSDTPPIPVPFMLLPLNDGSEYQVMPETVDEFEKLYPAVNVKQELRNMRGWLIANPANRKTKSGIVRFMNAWLAKEQNRARQGDVKKNTTGRRQLDSDEQAAIGRLLTHKE